MTQTLHQLRQKHADEIGWFLQRAYNEHRNIEVAAQDIGTTRQNFSAAYRRYWGESPRVRQKEAAE